MLSARSDRVENKDWDRGDIARLLDMIAPTKAQAREAVKNFGQVVKGGKLFVHPQLPEFLNR